MAFITYIDVKDVTIAQKSKGEDTWKCTVSGSDTICEAVQYHVKIHRDKSSRCILSTLKQPLR